MNFYEKLAPFMDEKESYKNKKLGEICKHVTYKKVGKGYPVFEENEINCEEAYVLVKGEVAIIRQPQRTTESKLTVIIDTPQKQHESDTNSKSPTSRSPTSSLLRGGHRKRNALFNPISNIQLTQIESTPVNTNFHLTTQSLELENHLKAQLFQGLESDIIKLIFNYGDLIVRLKYGEIFGQFALQSNNPRSATVLALEDSHLMVIKKKVFDVIKEYYSSEFSNRKEFLISVMPKIELISDIRILTKFLNAFEYMTLRKVSHHDH